MVALRRRSAVYAYTASTLAKVCDPGCGTAWTDGVSLGFDPDHVVAIGVQECVALLAHEAEHVIKGDPWRMHVWLGKVAALAKLKGGDQVAHQCYNEGSDHGINLRLERNAYEIGDDWLHDPAFDKVPAEQAASKLLAARPDANQGGNQGQPQQQQQGQQGQQGQGQGSGKGKGQAPAQGQPGAQNGAQPAPGQGQPNSKGQAPGASTAQGSGPGGQVRPFPTKAEAGTPAALKEAKRGYSTHKRNLSNALRYGEGNGETEGGAVLDIKKALQVDVDWAALLREFMTDRVPEDYSWARPQRDYMLRGIYMPTLHSEALGEVVLVADTSGSMDRKAFDEMAGHAHQVCTELGARLTVLYVDDSLKGVEHLEQDDDPASLQPVGGGCTDFRPAFKWLAEQDEEPACVIYFTDMQCSRFPAAHEVNVPLLWVQWGNAKVAAPPVGEMVAMNNERRSA